MSHKVLVVDDSPEICELVSVALKNRGIEVRAVMTGKDGIEEYSRFMPDLVLLDNVLPDLAGNEVARILKEMSAGKKALIIAMSGLEPSQEEIDAALYAGHLKKPFRLSEMIEYIEEYLK
jgi:two-component system OmpR family response regulator